MLFVIHCNTQELKIQQLQENLKDLKEKNTRLHGEWFEQAQRIEILSQQVKDRDNTIGQLNKDLEVVHFSRRADYATHEGTRAELATIAAEFHFQKAKWSSAEDMISAHEKLVGRLMDELNSTSSSVKERTADLQTTRVELEITKSDLYETRVQLEDVRTQQKRQNIVIKELKGKLLFESNTNQVARSKLEQKLTKAKAELRSLGQKWSQDYEPGDMNQMLRDLEDLEKKEGRNSPRYIAKRKHVDRALRLAHEASLKANPPAAKDSSA